MSNSICIFEDDFYSRLFPLVYLRPTYDLRCGILTLKEKIIKRYSDIPIAFHCRSYLSDLVKQQNPNCNVNEIKSKSCLFINGRVIVEDNFFNQIAIEGNDTIYVDGDQIIAARVSGNKLDDLKSSLSKVLTLSDFSGLFKQEIQSKIVNYPWDLITNNGKEIRNDFNLLTSNEKNNLNGKIYEGSYLVNKQNIFIAKNATVKPGAVLDAEDGPIYIDEDAKIFSNAVIIGPAFIGKKSQVKIGAKIYENTSIGEICKVGGEIEDSIIHSYSNKQHDGFLGHSYLGMWVNLGADTNNSDLKNNYGSVRVVINGEMIDSGTQFVGLTMGDHSKSAINTMFNTGTVVGISSNIFGAGFPNKYIPSFSWGGAEMITTYDLERSLEVAQRVMLRRKVKMTEAEEKVFRKVFDLTREERRKRGLPY